MYGKNTEPHNKRHVKVRQVLWSNSIFLFDFNVAWTSECEHFPQSLELGVLLWMVAISLQYLTAYARRVKKQNFKQTSFMSSNRQYSCFILISSGLIKLPSTVALSSVMIVHSALYSLSIYQL